MKIETFNTLNLIPIGNVRFTFTKRKSTPTRTFIHANDINILGETDMKITPETEKAVMSMMKKANSDLLTDGRDFYTTRGAKITQIKHGGFNSILEMAKSQGVDINVLLYS